MNYTVPLSKPYLTAEDIFEVQSCIKSSWISSKSPWIDKFEKLYAKNISKTAYAAAVNSGTSALFLSLKALNIGLGDEVILPSFTMIATINAVVWAGATPILVDSTSLNDWNINIKEIEKKITKRTRAIIPVHIYGYMCDMGKLSILAKKYSLHLIEDAAEAMGSEYHHKRAGSFGTFSCFSLYANKIITTGNGGMICTNDKSLYKLVKKLAFFDFNKEKHFEHLLFGYNLVLSGIQGALGCSQVGKFNLLIKKRRLIYSWYKEQINNNLVQLMSPHQGENPNYWFPAIIFSSKKKKKEAALILEKKRVETRDFFIPIHQQPVYQGFFNKKAFPVADYFMSHGLLLPSFHEIQKQDVTYITDIINNLKE